MPNLNVSNLNVPVLNVPNLNVSGISARRSTFAASVSTSASSGVPPRSRFGSWPVRPGVSNPYLSQIERGLRKPSAEILQQIAKALRISAEALYVQAGILEEREGTELAQALLHDPYLNERQKQVLIEIYDSFRKENEARIAAEVATQLAAAEGVEIEVSEEPVLSVSDNPQT